MRNKILSPDPRSIENSPLFSRYLKDSQRLSGNIQLNYNHKNQEVLHVSPIRIELTEDESLICERWVYSNKQSKIAKIQTKAGKLNNLIKTPEILSEGHVKINDFNFPFWIDKYVPGNTLDSFVSSNNSLKYFNEIMDWVAQFHQLEPRNQKLKEYYNSRFESFKNILNKKKNLQKKDYESTHFLENLVIRHQKNINYCVDENERTSLIHGDLRGGNIISSATENYILDFEQGVHGGDWFTDIFKLIKPNKTELSIIKDNSKYAPLLLSEQKKGLIKKYSDTRTNNSWEIPQFIDNYLNKNDLQLLSQRSKLSEFDNMLSVFLFRELLGEKYFTKDEKRGSKFVLELIKNKNEK